jgi:hypothetical protein
MTKQSRCTALQAEAAKQFFFPHSLPLNIQLDNDDDMSSYTSFLSVGSETVPVQLSDQWLDLQSGSYGDGSTSSGGESSSLSLV